MKQKTERGLLVAKAGWQSVAPRTFIPRSFNTHGGFPGSLFDVTMAVGDRLSL
jgi:hypothetical protein